MARVEAKRDAVPDDGDDERRGQSLSLRRAPVLVTFPDVARRRTQSFPSPLKLENEEDTEDMNPRNVWQVFPPPHFPFCSASFSYFLPICDLRFWRFLGG
ncbi:hypothetical protein ZIOFF_019418 [Zingiber officinale]|uniref:Uncharacterized protein n=1 Tax=Zingiber officinale TaxID=94328 RepID=A0A8J5HE76_ZINOF|nr:hypothetical protein ZIOFF_019418 [Zingiber officinale]